MRLLFDQGLDGEGLVDTDLRDQDALPRLNELEIDVADDVGLIHELGRVMVLGPGEIGGHIASALAVLLV